MRRLSVLLAALALAVLAVGAAAQAQSQGIGSPGALRRRHPRRFRTRAARTCLA